MPDEARFRALVEHSSDILAVVRDDGTLVYVSPAVQRILGHDPADEHWQLPKRYLEQFCPRLYCEPQGQAVRPHDCKQ